MAVKDDIETEDINGILEKNFAEWDVQRAEGLNNLLVFGLSKAESDERNFERLRRKYGAEHPQTLEAAASVEAHKILVEEMRREVVRAETPYPAERPDQWTIYGYVFDANQNPLAKAPLVIFAAEEDEVIRRLNAETDAKGFFRVRLDGFANLPSEVRVGVPPDFASDEVFTPEKGEIDYAEIIVTGEIGDTPPCEPGEQTPKEDRIPTGANFKDWLVTGKVTDAKGKGIADLKVRVFDKDLLDDDALGETETNADGVYRLMFTKDQFTDLGENYPELYLIIEDEAGNRVFDGKREAKSQKGRIELIDVKLKDFSGKTEKLDAKKNDDV